MCLQKWYRLASRLGVLKRPPLSTSEFTIFNIFHYVYTDMFFVQTVRDLHTFGINVNSRNENIVASLIESAKRTELAFRRERNLLTFLSFLFFLVNES